MADHARLLDVQRTRQFINLPRCDEDAGPLRIEESPMPGRSGEITVNFGASNGMIGCHIREVSANPYKKMPAFVPFAAVR